MKKGKVYLIGAGPGDPGLLTCKAKQLLSECDVVCYDKLVGAAILSLVPNHVQLHEVGYRGYQGCHINYGMHPDVMEFALAGKRVARLKSGDPCIFGRTTEECRDLKKHDIAYEIVPGITAALGAASYSGFPLTSAGVASSVTFISGHQHLDTLSAWGESGQAAGTLVLYMGAKKLAQHVEKLIAGGRSPQTPIALISSATRADHSCLKATLGTVIAELEHHVLNGPTLTIVGDVVTQSSELDWRSALPLNGLRLLICGEYSGAKALESRGAELIRVADLPIESLIDEEDLIFLSQQKALAFHDLAAFRIWRQALTEYQWDIRRFPMPIGSQDPHVAAAMGDMGLNCEITLDNTCITLTLDEEFISSTPSLLVGRRKGNAVAFRIPQVDWLLIDSIAVAKSILKAQPELFEQGTLIPLNREVEEWVMEQGLLSKENDMSAFLEQPELILNNRCADVA